MSLMEAWVDGACEPNNPLARRIKYGPLGHVVTLKWIPREHNEDADWLSKRKLRARGIGGHDADAEADPNTARRW
jgi:ribonuclease HI